MTAGSQSITVTEIGVPGLNGTGYISSLCSDGRAIDGNRALAIVPADNTLTWRIVLGARLSREPVNHTFAEYDRILARFSHRQRGISHKYRSPARA